MTLEESLVAENDVTEEAKGKKKDSSMSVVKDSGPVVKKTPPTKDRVIKINKVVVIPDGLDEEVSLLI